MIAAERSTSTMQPFDAQIRVSTGAKKLNAEEWQELSTDLWSGVLAAISSRTELEEQLRVWLALYEMRVAEQDSPWEDAANLTMPTIPAELDAMLSYITAAVFVPRLYMVSGNTEDATQTAPAVERYYNAELMRDRDGGKTWYDEYLTVIHFALRDGLGGLDTLWSKKKRFERIITFEPKIDDDGQVMLNDDGEIVKERHITKIEKKQSESACTPFSLKDFLWLPVEAPSVNDAVAVIRVEWWYESDMREKVAAVDDPDEEGYFDEEACDRALTMVDSGSTGTAQDEQGVYDKTAGGEFEIGQGQGAQTSKFFRNRGPLKVYRIHSRQYDLNRDGIPEENIFWVADATNELIGWMPYEYVTEGRPMFVYCPFPRPGRMNGYSLIERLADIAAEKSAGRNQRRNLIDLALAPPMLEKQGQPVSNHDKPFGPGVRWEVTEADAYTFMQMPQVPESAWQDTADLDQAIAKLTGQNAPSVGAQSSGRRSATEIKQAQAAQTTRANTIALRFRLFLRGAINFIHALNLQYLDDDPSYIDGSKKYTVPRDVLARDYQIDVAGASDPQDSSTRRTEMLAFVGAVSKFPMMASPLRQYQLLRILCEAWQLLPDGIIGTEQDAQQAAQQQQAMMAQQQQMAAAGQKPQPQRQPGAAA